MSVCVSLLWIKTICNSESNHIAGFTDISHITRAFFPQIKVLTQIFKQKDVHTYIVVISVTLTSVSQWTIQQ